MNYHYLLAILALSQQCTAKNVEHYTGLGLISAPVLGSDCTMFLSIMMVTVTFGNHSAKKSCCVLVRRLAPLQVHVQMLHGCSLGMTLKICLAQNFLNGAEFVSSDPGIINSSPKKKPGLQIPHMQNWKLIGMNVKCVCLTVPLDMC